LPPSSTAEAPEVLVVARAALLHPAVPQPDGTLLYELLTGHPDRQPRELVFVPDLTCELRAWTALGIDPQAAADAVLAGWQRGDLPGLRLGGLTAEEALAPGAPSHDLRARPARRPARPPARAGVPAVAAPKQRTSARRPLPVAVDTPAAAVSTVCGSVSAADTGRPDTWPHRRSAWPPRTPHAAAGVHCRSRPEAPRGRAPATA
jgi:hypothetical protein